MEEKEDLLAKIITRVMRLSLPLGAVIGGSYQTYLTERRTDGALTTRQATSCTSLDANHDGSK